MLNLLIIFGVFIRFLFIGVPGFKADIAFWKGWGLAVADKGILWLVNNTNYNYPPGFAYILYIINKIYSLFRSPYQFNDYWLDNNLLYLFIFKLITIAADIVIVYLIIKTAKKIKFPYGKLLAVLYLLNPVTILDGVIWGQVDQFGVAIFLVSVYLLMEEQIGWASVVFTISYLMKLQNIIFIPIFYLFIFKKNSLKGLMKSLQFSALAFLVVTIPFWFNHQMDSLIKLFTINSNWFPWLSLNAFNLWWLVSGLKGMQVSDKILVLGILNAKQVGLIIFSLSYLWAMLLIFISKKDELLKNFLLASALIVFSFFHFLTQSHERYLFPIVGIMALFFIFDKKENLKRNISFYFISSILIFLNMYIAVFFNYPDQVFWLFSQQITLTTTLLISWLQIVTFGYFILMYLSRWLIKYWVFLTSTVIIVVFFIIAINVNYLFGKPISLTKLTPIDSYQEYLTPQTDMAVNSALGVFSWNRLSNNYYFFNQGIGSHANSIITYGLGGRFSKLQTTFGIDTEGDETNKAIFIIKGDGRELYRSEPKGKFDLPETISISINKVDKLSLVINRVGDSINGLHADWLDPFLIK